MNDERTDRPDEQLEALDADALESQSQLDELDILASDSEVSDTDDGTPLALLEENAAEGGQYHVFPYRSGQDAVKDARRFGQRTTKIFQQNQILKRLEVSGENAVPAVPVLLDCFSRQPTATRHSLLEIFQKLVDEGQDLSDAAEELGRFLNDANYALREKLGALLVSMGPQAEKASMRALGCTRNNNVDICRLGVQVLGAIGPACERQAQSRLQSMLETVGQKNDELRQAIEDALEKVSCSQKSPTDVLRRAEMEQKRASSPGEEMPVGAIAGARVLIAEDDPRVRNILTTLLEKAGAMVVACEDGEAAVGMLEECDEAENGFDLILLDLMMPRVNGLEVLKTVRETPAHSDTSVLIMSGVREKTAIAACVKLGISGYILKPLEMRKFIHTINDVLQENIHECEAS